LAPHCNLSNPPLTAFTQSRRWQRSRKYPVVTSLSIFKYGLVSPAIDPTYGGWWFNDEAIRTLRRIEYLRGGCGINLTGIKLIMELTKEVELLRQELHFLNRQ
jgi:MerR HTH family regulatory protein